MDQESANVRRLNSCIVKISPTITNLREEYKSQHSNIETRQYYKKYNAGDDSVKDEGNYNNRSISKDNAGQGDKRDSITNFDLDEIEMKILNKMSQELQTDDNSVSSLDSNIKLFKTTVNQILENFYINVKEFELYKKKFHEILEKNKGDIVTEMEDLIKDMIQHVGSSESSVNNSKLNETKECNKDIPTHSNCKVNIDVNKNNVSKSLNSTTEAFKNESYLTDSTFEQNSSKLNTSENKEKFLNISLLSGTRCVEIKMNDRSIFSEINIRDQDLDCIKEPLASAENLKKLKDKKHELDKYFKEQELHLKDREIPVKSSNAKKNIHLDEDFLDNDKDECNKFFIFRICNYLCRKLRKNAFA
ncbi:uncharacterized protein LOC124531283 [Vanessa cardui]|uniref:uncharacterized protein LOC124531283 n=1 Tax=Vanessa cardui TaxID=171605 RepID=UPI001F12BD48|nr:uncharacterized protein LOC124531283 [Vanessa cardui]